MEDIQKHQETLQQRCQDEHRECQRLRTAQAAPTFVVQRERKLRRFCGRESPLGGRSALVYSHAEVER